MGSFKLESLSALSRHSCSDITSDMLCDLLCSTSDLDLVVYPTNDVTIAVWVVLLNCLIDQQDPLLAQDCPSAL